MWRSKITSFTVAAVFAAIGGLVAAAPSYALTLVGTTGDASGIDGLVIDGTTYDVTFVRDSYNNVYASTPPTFLNSAEIGDATTALISALNILDVTKLIGMSTPDGFAVFVAAIPQSLSGATVNTEGAGCATPSGADCSADTWGVVTAFPNVSDTNPINSSEPLDYTVFTVAATPLPAALPLFASGLGALGLFGWRRKRKHSATTVAA